jgi:hypothetical protein
MNESRKMTATDWLLFGLMLAVQAAAIVWAIRKVNR